MYDQLCVRSGTGGNDAGMDEGCYASVQPLVPGPAQAAAASSQEAAPYVLSWDSKPGCEQTAA